MPEIISDEIYADLRFTKTPYTSILSCDPRGIDGVLHDPGVVGHDEKMIEAQLRE